MLKVDHNHELRVQFISQAVRLFKHCPHENFTEEQKDQWDLDHAAKGVAGESGELVDAIKRYTVYEKPLDRKNVIEELGDLRFYMTALQLLLDISEEEVLQANLDKLAQRYPAGIYTNEHAQQRLDKTES